MVRLPTPAESASDFRPGVAVVPFETRSHAAERAIVIEDDHSSAISASPDATLAAYDHQELPFERDVLIQEDGHNYEIGGDYEFALAGGRLKLIGLNRFSEEPYSETARTSF